MEITKMERDGPEKTYPGYGCWQESNLRPLAQGECSDTELQQHAGFPALPDDASPPSRSTTTIPENPRIRKHLA